MGGDWWHNDHPTPRSWMGVRVANHQRPWLQPIEPFASSRGQMSMFRQRHHGGARSDLARVSFRRGTTQFGGSLPQRVLESDDCAYPYESLSLTSVSGVVHRLASSSFGMAILDDVPIGTYLNVGLGPFGVLKPWGDRGQLAGPIMPRHKQSAGPRRWKVKPCRGRGDGGNVVSQTKTRWS